MSGKFIIGLGNTVPSTRILKPTGGGSSDLFGLNTRQKAILQVLEKKTGTMSHFQVRQLIDKSISQNTFSKRSESSETIKSLSDHVYTKPTELSDVIAKRCTDLVQVENEDNYNLKRCNGRENLLEQYAAEDRKRDNTPKNATTNPGSKLKSVQSLPVLSKNEKGCKNSKSYRKMSILENEAKGLSKVQSPFRSRIRNPITGTTVEVNRNKLCNLITDIDTNNLFSHQECKRKQSEVAAHTSTIDIGLRDSKLCNLITDIDSNSQNSQGSYKNRPAGVTGKIPFMEIGLGNSKRKCQIYARRNPITGEGTIDDSNCYQFAPRGIRVIQPPGGISCGFY